MAVPGERFVIDFSDDENDGDKDHSFHDEDPRAGPMMDLIGEIKERTPTAPTPPAPKKPSTSVTGFPAPRNRDKHSAFKQRRSGTGQAPSAAGPFRPQPSATSSTTRLQPPSIEEERQVIDEENRRRLATMSPAQIEKERAELMSGLAPSLIERLLRRANIDDEDGMSLAGDEPSLSIPASKPSNNQTQPSKSVSLDVPESPPGQPRLEDPVQPQTSRSSSRDKPLASSDERPPSFPPPDLRPASEFPQGPVHFPTPPPRQNPMPNLDPSSPSFLADLQSHYFPETPHDLSSLSWMQFPPRDPDDPDAVSAYHPASSATAVIPSALRFSWTGTVLSPSTSLSLPSSLGLHHHAEDPEAAGYTIPELSILSRSTIAAQRCVAWQVIGRILYRLGKGEFGEPGSPLVEGLWSVVERKGVVSRMLEEAEGAGSSSEDSHDNAVSGGGKAGIGRHASAKAWALEGIWLWQRSSGGARGVLNEGSIRSR